MNENEFNNNFNENNNEIYSDIHNDNNNIDDDRLIYALITLGLENLIKLFEEKNITFIDFLLLSKEDLKELELTLFQRNRIFNFIKNYCKYAKDYSIGEIYEFFLVNKQFIFNSVIYDNIFKSQKNINYNVSNNLKNHSNFNNNNINIKKYKKQLKKKNFCKSPYQKRNVIKKFIKVNAEIEIFLDKLEREQEKYYNIQKKYYHILNNNNNNNDNNNNNNENFINIKNN